ncbi:MAG: glycosyltransferase [Blastocatellia bacterium]
MSGLRILITNNTLGPRAGTELYVRDLATALMARGHKPIAYSTQLGEVADELRLATIPVIDNLAALSAPPDIIHGHHHLETMTALLRFPNAPAIYFCHGWLPWEEAPPHFPRILRYVAVDEVCRDRLVYEHAIPVESVRVLFNFVDLDRFKPRGPLPSRPQRALVFSNQAGENSYLIDVRRACAEAGIALDVIGMKAGNACARPEESLGNYDLVFAKARAALEALAVGTAVVLCDAKGVGPMVTLAELERLRPLNFGIRALRRPITPAVISREIAQYDPEDAAAVSARIRATAGRDAAIDQVIELYQEAIAEHAAAGPRDTEAEERAAADYLLWISPRIKEFDQLKTHLEALSGSVAFRLRECLWRAPVLARLYRALRRG